jgi:hypothetical protein
LERGRSHGRTGSSAAATAAALAVACATGCCQAGSAFDVVQALKNEDGYCVVSGLSRAELEETSAETSAADLEGHMLALEGCGLTAFEAAGRDLIALVDMRPGRKPPEAADRTVLGSHLLALLPDSVLAAQADAGRATNPPNPRFPFADQSGAARQLVSHLLASGRAAQRAEDELSLDGDSLFGRVSMRTRIIRRDDATVPASVEETPFLTWYFREPPMVLDPHLRSPGRHMLWFLWGHDETAWAQAPCPEFPSGDTTVSSVLAAVAGSPNAALTVDDTVEGVGDQPLYLTGQARSLGALMWALQVCAGLTCGTLEGDPPVAEVRYESRPRPMALDYLCALPGRGYISPQHTELGKALLTGGDYGRIIPLGAWWRLLDLPLIYSWAFAHDRDDAESLSLLWAHYIELIVTAPADARHGPIEEEFVLPVL